MFLLNRKTYIYLRLNLASKFKKIRFISYFYFRTEAKTRVIAPLPGLPSIYIVAIEKMLGVFSPVNLLEMEPSFKVIIGISPTLNDPHKYNLSVDCVESLLQEFTGLSCDDYSEAQVRSVFHHMQDLDEDSLENLCSV